MNVIATYQEKRMDGYRVFELYSDRVVVKGAQYIGGKFETTVMLQALEPTPSKLVSRNRAFFQGIVMALVATTLIQSNLLPVTSYWGGLALVLGIGGVLMSLTTLRPIEWANFCTSAGISVVSIARAGPDAKRFQEFVDLFSKQVSAAKQNDCAATANGAAR